MPEEKLTICNLASLVYFDPPNRWRTELVQFVPGLELDDIVRACRDRLGDLRKLTIFNHYADRSQEVIFEDPIGPVHPCLIRREQTTNGRERTGG